VQPLSTEADAEPGRDNAGVDHVSKFIRCTCGSDAASELWRVGIVSSVIIRRRYLIASKHINPFADLALTQSSCRQLVAA
jgi:hypothetical protein